MISIQTALLASTFCCAPQRALARRKWAAWGKRPPQFVVVLSDRVGDIVPLAQVGCLPPGSEIVLGVDTASGRDMIAAYWIGADGHMNIIGREDFYADPMRVRGTG